MKTPPYLLAASLICGDFLNLKNDIKLLEKGKIDYIHFDVMDGLFVPRYGLFPEVISQIRSITDIPLDIHMMVEDAEHYIETFVKAGADKADDIYVVHAEATQHLDRVLRKIHEHGIKAGVALNPGTSLSVLDYVLPNLDLVMLMAINPGIVGHKLIPHMIDKISDLKKILRNHPEIIIEVDGGVNFESAPKMIKAGATMLVCGTQTIYRPEAQLDIKIKELRTHLNIQ
jgi:ribulose-phosphate 3-epimerase